MLAPGTNLLSRFVIEREVQRGGMGTLYRAADRERSCPVAVKVMGAGTDADHERFSREAQALCALDHPAIVRYVAEGTTESGESFLVMEWLEGEDLAARLERGALSIDESVRVATRIAQALGYAHRVGLVHRDVKPSNLFVPGGRLEELTLIDFGLVRFLGSGPRATASHVVLGTPGYLAPEQARGEAGIDARADVFALGSVLYECLTGRPAFDGDSILAILSQIVFAEAPRVSSLMPGIPHALDDLVARMLAREPEHRPRDGEDVVRELADVLVRPLAQLRPRATRTSSSGERRLLSIILARAAQEPVSEETVQMVAIDDVEGPWQAVCQTVVSHDARLERLADGSIVAVVSGAWAATDQAVRAGRIVLALQEGLRGWRMAVATGLGEDTGPPVGDVVERAARVLGPPGTIRLDELTAGLLAGRFELRYRGAHLELSAEKASPTSARVLLGKPTPCVGREHERAMLRGFFQQCAADRVTRAVLVTGPPGAGKSRLRHELVEELMGRAWVVSGQGDDVSAGAPFGVLAPALRTAVGISDDEPAAVRRGVLQAWVVRHLPTAEAERVGEFLGELVGLPAPLGASLPLRMARRDADLMDAQMLRAFEDLVRAASAQQPVLIILDDLQWGDAPSIRFVDAALGLRGCPVFVLALARPEVHEVLPGLWSARAVREINLPPLSDRACDRLIHVVLGDTIPARRVDRIVEQASGNAFFLEELIRAEAAGMGDSVPATVLAMMHARLSALAPEALRTLCRASVFGRSFRASAIEAVGGVVDVLDELAALELVHARASARFPGDAELVFRHDLLRQAAYEMLRDEDRADAHLGAALWLGRSGEAGTAVLARHFERAGRLERAAAAYLAAARSSLEGQDMGAAVEHAEACVRCGPEDAVRAEVRLIQGEALVWKGDVPAAEAPLREARALLQGGGPLLPEALAWLAKACVSLGKGDEAVRCAEELAVADLRGARSGRLLRVVRRVMGTLQQTGRGDVADALLARLEAWVAEAPPDPTAALEIDFMRVFRALTAGDYERFLSAFERIIAAQEGAGDLKSTIVSRLNLGFALTEVGEPAGAEPALRQAMADATRGGFAVMHATAQQNLGLALYRLGRLEEARSVLLESIACYRAYGDTGYEASSRLYLARVNAADGRLDEAEQGARLAVDGLADYPSNRAYALATLARVLLGRERAGEALELAERAMAILEEGVEFEEGESVVHLSFAEALEAAGRAEAARDALRVAHDRLAARAARIRDPRLRRSFLTRVDENAALLALSRARLGW